MRFRSFVVSVACLLSALFYTAPEEVAHAQALPAVSSAVNWAVGSLVALKASAMGFAANDPRIVATENAMSSVAESAAAGASVAWLGLQTAVMAAMLAVPTPLSADSVDQWQFNANGTISISGNPAVAGGSVSPPWSGLTPGQPYWVISGFAGSSALAVVQASIQSFNAEKNGQSETAGSCTPVSSVQDSCTYSQYLASNNQLLQTVSEYVNLATGSWSGPSCASGMATNSTCTAYVASNAPAPVTPSTGTPAAAIAAIPSSDDGDPLNPTIVAAMTDALWDTASQLPGYSGLPYPVNDPVSSADAATDEAASGSSWPTIGDAVAPVTSPSGAPAANNPYSIPDSAPGTAVPVLPASATPTATDPGSGAQVNLGPDPGIGSPTLETPPTAAQILAPILGLLPDLRSYVVPSHTSVCPEPTFDLWGTTYTFTVQCDLLAANASAIYAAFVLAYSVAALFIVLTA